MHRKSRFMTQSTTSDELALAKQLATTAGETMLKYFDINQQKQTKDDGTPVTIADKEINSIVIATIKERFPGDGIVGEEESTSAYGMGRSWICDPIDGTAAYVVGLPSAMFSIAFVVDGKPTVAVAYEPHTKRLYNATLGQGSYCNDVRIQVSKDSLELGLIALAPDYIRPKYIDEPFMRNLLRHDKQLSIFPGAVFRGCMISTGRIAGSIHPKVKPYDIAAVHLIIEEAGGKVTDISGQPLNYAKDFRGAILSNGVVHDELIKLFKDD